MKIFDYFKNKINQRKNKNQLLLNIPQNTYRELLQKKEISNILDNIPKNLSEIEKAYYIYIELGKVVKDNPKFLLAEYEQKKEIYNNKIDKEYYGICKSISELYVSMLKDKRVGISADLSKMHPKSEVGHVDAILNIGGKHYITNLISDLSRIKTSRRINSFCFDLNKDTGDTKYNEENYEYLQRLENYYGKIDSISREDIEQLDKKIGYSFFVPKITQNKRGIYTEDTIKVLKEEMEDPGKFKEYVLNNKDIPEEEWLKCKMNYLFKNIAKITEFSGNVGFLEIVRYYMKLFSKVLTPEEASRVTTYVGSFGDDLSKPIACLTIKPLNKTDNENMDDRFFLYYSNNNIHIRKELKDIESLAGKTDKDHFRIIGAFDIIPSEER